MAKKSGLQAALDVVDLTAPPPGADDAEQLPLLPLDDWADPIGKHGVAGGPGAGAAPAAAGVSGKRKVGRPPGSKNRRTEEWIDYLMSRYASPLVVLAETYSRPVGELAKRLKCSTQDAFKIQQAAALGLAPYVHQRQPIAVEVDSKGVINLVIQSSPEVAALAGQAPEEQGLVTIDGEILESEEKQ